MESLSGSLQLRLAERTQAISGVGRATPEVQDIFRKISDFFAAP
jgi:hypothetical protein